MKLNRSQEELLQKAVMLKVAWEDAETLAGEARRRQEMFSDEFEKVCAEVKKEFDKPFVWNGKLIYFYGNQVLISNIETAVPDGK